MGKFFGSIAYFLVALVLVYFLNLTVVDGFAQTYLTFDSFEAVHLIATFELLHHPFEYFWVIPSWLIAAFIGGLISRSWKGAIVVSLIIGFVLSLTWLFFMWRYVPNYYNNFILNIIPARFISRSDNDTQNNWSKNYWQRPRVRPKIIPGAFWIYKPHIKLRIPRFNVDYFPAQEPYDIEV